MVAVSLFHHLYAYACTSHSENFLSFWLVTFYKSDSEVHSWVIYCYIAFYSNKQNLWSLHQVHILGALSKYN